MKVLHVLPTLGMGGAERLASELAARGPDDIEPVFVSMVPDPPFFPMAGVRIETLGLKRGQFSLEAARAFRALVRREAPDIVQGWLYHGNILASLARDLGPAILWSIHNTSLDARGSKPVTRALNRVAALISSRVPDHIVYCAEEARGFHERLGYDRDRGLVIPNGVDLERFKPCPPRRHERRRALGARDGDFLCGQFGRLDVQKGLPVLLAAFRILRDRVPHARLVLAGSGFDPGQPGLVASLEAMGLDGCVSLLGARHDMPDLLGAIDVLVIASTFGEALPMIALEAAATGLPIVTTDIGEAKRLALDPSHVVDAGDAAGLAEAVCRVWSSLRSGTLAPAIAARHATLTGSFEIGRTIDAYAGLYRAVAAAKASGRTSPGGSP